MPKFTVSITDEFNHVWTFHRELSEEVIELVSAWLKTHDETPIYEISIQIS